MVHDSGCPAIKAEAQRDVIADPRAGKRGEQDEEREQRGQQARAEQRGQI